jgi:pimeloyl-ACP methyl ester carboxylesterase
MVNCVKEYINKKLKNEKFIILGHSMGGGITQVICKMFKKQITGVILECPYNQGATLAAYESNFKKLIKNKATTAALKKEINADLKKYETVNKNAPKSDPFAA